MINDFVKVIWQDIYTVSNGTLEEVIKDLSTYAHYISVGKKVYENKEFIILLQNDCGDKSDYIVIPKGTILKIEKLTSTARG